MDGKTIRIMSVHTQEATCGLQVCQHPLCWATNRQVARGLLHPSIDEELLNAKRDSTNSSLESPENEFEEENLFEDLPTVTIFNMLDEYGFNRSDRYPSPSLSAIMSKQNRKFKSQETRNIPPEGSHVMPKLTLKALASHSTDDVMAPANTPLQSSHGFGDYHDYRSPLGHSKFGSHKPAFTETTVSVPPSEIGSKRIQYHKIKMELNAGDSVGLKPKRMLVWCPGYRGKRRQSSRRRPQVPKSMKAVSLPLSTVPEFKNEPLFSHKAIRGAAPKKTHRFPYQTIKADKISAAVNKSTSTSGEHPTGTTSSRATPQEIAQLRKVPIDVLMRVLHQAEEKGVITSKQTSFLLRQVTGQKEKLPSIQETQQQRQEEEEKERDLKPKTPLETKNIKILDADERIRSPRTIFVDPVYRMDMENEVKTRQALGLVPPSTEYGSPRKSITPIDIPKPFDDFPPKSSSREEKVRQLEEDDTDSQYNNKLRQVAAENLRSIGALPREGELTSPKKTPVKYVATVFDDGMPQTPPIKPFHYPRSPREIFLGPIPSPPPPSSPTERESSYDEQAGGSTMIVNPSLSGPPTITSFGEKVPSSASGSQTPTTGRDGDGRPIKMTQTGQVNVSQRRRHIVSSPYGSSSADVWPQINEEDFMLTRASTEIPESPMLSFTEEDLRALSRNESTSTIRGETPIADKFQNLQQGEIHSPAPPPPSPEPMAGCNHHNNEEKISSSPRIGGAATALGLVALTKESPSENSTETGGGLTPTPVVSSATSGVETPLGRVTRTHRLNSTPAIAETPFENESEDAESTQDMAVDGEKKVVEESVEASKSNEKNSVNADDFEKNVSPEIAKEELEIELKKIDLS